MLDTFAPPFKLVGGYFVAGIIFLFLSIFSFAGVDFEAILSLKSASFFHIFLIGFVMCIIIGALYQLTSVILEKPFFTLKFAYINLTAFALSLFVLTLGMHLENLDILFAGAAVLVASFIYFCTIYLMSFLSCKVKSFAVVAIFFSGIFLFVGAIFGGVLVLILKGFLAVDFMKILFLHIYLVLGAMYFVILGVSSVLIPMFSLAHKIKFYFYYMAFGFYIFGFFVIWFEPDMAKFFALLSVMFFVIQCILILQNRARKAYEYWNLNVYFSFFALILGFSYLYLGSINKAIFALTFGFLYAFIVGHLYKITPFLIWYHYISPFVGKIEVPMLDDMIMKKTAYTSLGFNFIALVAFLLEFELASMVAISISVILVIVNMFNFYGYTKFGRENG